MKEIKPTTVAPVADPKAARKPAPKPATGGATFDEALSDSLNSTVANMSDLNQRIQTKTTAAVSDADAAREEISTAEEEFARMMLQKQNLFQLYQRITNKEDG